MVLLVKSCQPFPDFHYLLIAGFGELVARHPCCICGFFERLGNGDSRRPALSLNNWSGRPLVSARRHVWNSNGNRARHSGNHSGNLPVLIIGRSVRLFGMRLLSTGGCGDKAYANENMPTSIGKY